MSVQQLLTEYIEEHRSGGAADPVAFLERADPDERRELAVLIDAYLERAPRAAFDEEAYKRSPARGTVEALERSISGASGLWPVVLPRLRAQAGLKRRELVERLAISLGQGPKEEKVAAYYHEMEQGLLPASGVSDRVLEALGSLVGSTVAALRQAGEAIEAAGLPPRAGRAAYARAAIVDETREPAADVGASRGEGEPDLPAQASSWDEVDELFRGGAR